MKVKQIFAVSGMLPICMVDCTENRQLAAQRAAALKICRECLHTLREAIGTTHFAEFLDDARQSHELLLVAQGTLNRHREEHGCQTQSGPRLTILKDPKPHHITFMLKTE